MAEERIFFDSGGLRIEGLLEELPGERAVTVTHPHPLYGGSMHNNVVEAVVKAYKEKGFTTLRFNFRGVGGSEGRYDDGRAEQEDILSALSYLINLGKKSIDLAGYSFGAWVIAMGLDKFDKASRVIVVSPPVSFISFDFLGYNPKIQLVIVGTRDDIAGPRAVEKMLSTWNPEAALRIIKGADHFYSGYEKELKGIIEEFLA